MICAENTAFSGVMASFTRAAAEGRPVFVLDETRRCILSGCPERLAVGESIDDFLLLPHTDGGVHESSMLRLGRTFCVRYMDVTDGTVGEILGGNEMSMLMQLTDGVRNHAAFHSAMEYDLSLLWEKKNQLHRLISSDAAEELFGQMEKALYRVSAGSRNSYEYSGLMYAAAQRTVVDIARLCRELVTRCNSALSDVGRSIILRCAEGERMYIRSTARSALAAMLNAVQNALLYSPRESVPVLELTRDGRHIRIEISNVNALFGREDAAQASIRGGYGIPILRRFAALTEGELSLSLSGQRAVVSLCIPSASEEEMAEYALEEAAVHEFREDIPDYIALRMMQVADMYR